MARKPIDKCKEEKAALHRCQYPDGASAPERPPLPQGEPPSRSRPSSTHPAAGGWGAPD